MLRILIAIFIAVSAAMCPQQLHAKKHKPLKKVHVDTIAIPDDIFFQTETTEELTETSGEDIYTTILGDTRLEVERMYRFVLSRNPEFPREIAEAFYNVGKRYGIRGDIALCQSILETGWFTFTGGTAVTLEQNNFCGLGVTKLGVKGHAFDTIEEGVTAQIQHLYAYACKKKLPKGEKLIDPRFSLVHRGIAPTWADLNRRWAANSHYADRIMKLYSQMASFEIND